MLFCVFAFHSYAATPDQPKQVLVVFGEEMSMPAVQAVDTGIRSVFSNTSGEQIQIHSEHLDNARVAPPETLSQGKELQRYVLSEENLPSGSIVRFKVRSPWELHNWWILSGVAFMLFQSALIIYLLVQRSRWRRAEKSLDYKLRFESLLSDLSATFVNLPIEWVDHEMESVLNRLAQFWELDRISLFEFVEQERTMVLKCSARVAGIPPAPSKRSIADFPWLMSNLICGREVLMRRPQDLPPEGEREWPFLESNVKSAAIFRLSGGRSILGCIVFASFQRERLWPEELAKQLRIVSEVLANVLAHKRDEEALRESEQRFRVMADTAPVMVWMSGIDKLCTFFSKPWLEFTGRTLEQELGIGWSDGVHSDDLQRCLGGYVSSFDARLPFSMEYRLRHADGGYRSVLDRGIPRYTPTGEFAGYIGSCVDMTELKRAEGDLHDTEDLKTAILSSLASSVAVLDKSGVIVSVNRSWMDFGPVPGALFGSHIPQGMNYLEVCRGLAISNFPSANMLFSGVSDVLLGDRDAFELEYPRNTDGETNWFLVSVTPLRREAGGVVVTHKDITDRKKTEENLLKLSGRLINAQEAERARIARELHDDFSQRLAVLAMELGQLSQGRGAFDQKAKKRLHIMWEGVTELSSDIHRLSHRLHSAKLRHVGLLTAARSLCEETAKRHHLRIEFAHQEMPEEVSSDVGLCLFRTLQEALNNIVKHSGAKQAKVQFVGTPAAIRLRIVDTGVGFDPQSRMAGEGLGLASMRERLRLVDGNIAIRSRPMEGTEILAEVPVTHNGMRTGFL